MKPSDAGIANSLHFTSKDYPEEVKKNFLTIT